MRLLFIGDYDMAGSAIASRMYREGGQIAWLTAEPSRTLWSSKVHGHVFRFENTPPQQLFRQVLDGDETDWVVLCTAAWREGTGAGGRGAGYLLSLIEAALEVAAVSKVGHVCLLSSERLREERVLDAGLEELRAAERMTGAFCKAHDIPLLTLRFGHLFGTADPTSTLAGQLMDDLASGRTASCPYTPASTLDLICDTDLADAFLRLANLQATGVHTVLTGTPVTAQELVGAATAAVEDGAGEERGAAEDETRAGTPAAPAAVAFSNTEYLCDESRAQATRLYYGWMPFHLFAREGTRQLAIAHRTSYDRRAQQASLPWWKRLHNHPLWWELVQNLIAFAVMCVLSAFNRDFSDLRYVDVRLLYVVIIAVCFGMRQGLIATALACVNYAGGLIFSGVDLTYLLYSVSGWVPFIVYGVAGAFGGYWSDKKNDEYDALEREHGELDRRYDLLKGLYREVVGLKNRLQKQIAVSKDSLSNIYAITSELDAENPLLLIARTVHVTEELMECDAVAIYRLSGGGRWGRLTMCSASLTQVLSPSLDLDALPALDAARGGGLFVNTELDARYPSLAMEIENQGEPVVLMAVYHLPLERFTADDTNRFRTLVKMVGDHLAKAIESWNEQPERTHLAGTRVLTPEAFDEQVRILRAMNDGHGFPFSLARLTGTGDAEDEATDIYERASKLLRDTDLLGLGSDGALYAAFPYVDEGRRPQLEQRLRAGCIDMQWEGAAS